MPTNNRAFGPSLLLLLIFVATTAVRAADVLQAIPDTALAIVLVNRLEETSDKIERLAKLVGAPQQSVLTMLRVKTGIHEGLDEKGTAALAVMPSKDAGSMPQSVLLLPVSDYKKFLAQLQPDDATKKFAAVRLAGVSALVCQHGDFAALAPPENQAVLEDMLNSVKDVSGDLSPLRTWLGEVDAAAISTTPGIKFGIEQAQFFLPLIRGGALGVGAQQPGQQQTITETLNLLEQGLKSVGSEVTHAALGLKADENSNFRIAGRVRFAAGGEWASAAKGIKAPKEGLLAGLPGGPFGVAIGMMMPQGLREAFGNQIAATMRVNPALAQLPAEQQTRLAVATVEMMAPIESMAMAMGIPKPGDPLYSNVAMVVKVDDAQKYLDQYSASVTLINDAFKNPQAPSISYEVQKIDIDGAAALDIITDLSGFTQPGAVDIKPMFAKMFGPGDKIHTYLAVADGKTAVMAYVGVDSVKRALAAAKATDGGLAADPQIAETSALLPKGAQWLSYIDLHGMLDFTSAIMAAMPAAGQIQLPAIPAAPPIGIAGKISATGLNVDTAVPGATLQAIGQVVAKLRGLQ